MAHVKITAPSPTRGKAQITVDGVDITHSVMMEPFEIKIGNHNEGVRTTVVLALACDPLELDLPDATLDAVVVRLDGGERGK